MGLESLLPQLKALLKFVKKKKCYHNNSFLKIMEALTHYIY